MLKAVLVDDCREELKTLEFLLGKYFSAHELDYELKIFSSPADFINSLSFPDEDVKYDIYFLDVMMPGMNGIELGKKIRQVDESAKLIYISSSSDFALQSFEARAFYYLLKPVNEESFNRVMDMALKELQSDFLNTINIKTGNEIVRLLKGDIICVELKDRKSLYTLKTKSVSSAYLTTSFISANSELLDDPRFFACGASLILNLRYIDSISRDGSVTMNSVNGKELVMHIPQRIISGLNSAWMKYCLEVRQ